MQHRNYTIWWDVVIYKDGRQTDSYSTNGGEDGKSEETMLASLRKEHPDPSYTFKVTAEPIDRGEIPRAILVKRFQAMRPSRPIPAESIEEFGDYFLPEPSIYGVARVIPLAEAKKEMLHGEWEDFVYLRPLGVVVFDVKHHTSHEIFMSHWYRLFKFAIEGGKTLEQIDNMDWGRFAGEQDLFIEEDYGFFMSSAFGVGHVTCSKYSRKLNAAEKQVFGHLTFIGH
jgi:hypothetical protein